MAIKNTVSIDFLSTFLDSIGVFDCGLPGVFYLPTPSKVLQLRISMQNSLDPFFHSPNTRHAQIYAWTIIIISPDVIMLGVSGLKKPTPQFHSAFIICNIFLALWLSTRNMPEYVLEIKNQLSDT